MVVFLFGTFGCALAPSFGAFVLARGIAGLGAALILPNV